MNAPTAIRVRELFKYDHETGIFTRAKNTRGHFAGEVVGTLKDNGYLHFSIDYKKYGAHRVAWLHYYGEMPDGDVDHIDGDRTNNSIRNLRVVDRSTNLENIRAAKSHNKSTGVLGAYKIGDQSFFSRIRVKGKDIYLGCFDSAVKANEAYMAAKRQLHAGNTI